MFKHVLLYYMFIVIQIIYLTVSETTNTYGEFTLKLIRFDICKGPKRMDCTILTGGIINDTVLSIKLGIEKDLKLNRGKIVSSVNNKTLVRLQMKNPCNHFYMKTFFVAIYNVTQDCEFKKGYYIKNIDIAEVAEKYYGGMFLYGNLTFKSIFYNDECNFSCVDVEVNLSPKKNKKSNKK